MLSSQNLSGIPDPDKPVRPFRPWWLAIALGVVAIVITVILATNGAPKAQRLDQFDAQGHRGARGLYPENTVQGMMIALDYGMTTLEMDAAVSKDKQIILSHEPYFSPHICYEPTGGIIPQSNPPLYRIMDIEFIDIRRFDCGSVPNPDFPLQKKAKDHKPRLQDVVEAARKKLGPEKFKALRFNIETKSKPEWDGLLCPKPDEFVRLLLAETDRLGITDQITLQSFDVRTLQVAHQTRPEVKLVLLVENAKSLDENLKELGFDPYAYSPDYVLVTQELVDACHNYAIRLIPWTVNQPGDMEQLINMGVDGLITDYPDRLRQVMDKLGL